MANLGALLWLVPLLCGSGLQWLSGLLLKDLKAIFVETTGSFLGREQVSLGDFFDSGS